MDGSPSTAEKPLMQAEPDAAFQHALETAKLEALAEFAAGAGHEINNPLTVISGRAQLLLRDETDPERRHALALISAQAMRVYEMIADMMLFARPPRPELQRIDVGRLIDGLASDLSSRCAAQQTAVCRVGQAGATFVEADPVQLEVALRAICQNALEALPSGGRLEIDVEPAGERQTRIRIRDDGPGFDAEQRQHIFEPFYSAREAGRGLGLGLSKAWRIVTNHGGRIEVESQPGRGATFTIVLESACDVA